MDLVIADINMPNVDGNPEKAAEQPAVSVAHNDDAAQALLAATVQIGLALRESQGPVAELGDLCARLSEGLATLQANPHVQNATEVERLQAQVSKGIQQLQFYDRMVQHLTHIQDYLTSVANELGVVRTDAPAAPIWDELHARLRKGLISDEQRGLLDLMLSPEAPTRVSAQAPRPDYSAPGSFELFE